jgi:uncharacterized SAM-binding protein YcdF (DUF218 family)
MLLTIVKAIGAPGSFGFLLVTGIAGLLLYSRPRFRRLARLWLFTLAMGYFLTSLPVVATAITSLLPDETTSTNFRPHDLDLLIVIEGDNADGRLREASRIYQTVAPVKVVALGGGDFFNGLVAAGIPRDQITLMQDDRNTRQQIATVLSLAGAQPKHRVAVVASRLQIPRVAKLARAGGGSDVQMVSSPADTEPPRAGLRTVLPNLAALAVSRDALYEIAALAYYGFRGWI